MLTTEICQHLKIVFEFSLFWLENCSKVLNRRASIQRQCRRRTRTKRVWKRKTMRSMERHSAGLAERTMHQMNFGFVVMSARSGSMVSVLRSPLRELNTSNNTNAHLAAATSELGLDICCVLGNCHYNLWLTANCPVGQIYFFSFVFCNFRS